MFFTYFFLFMTIWFFLSWDQFKHTVREEGRKTPFKEWSIENKLFIFKDYIWFSALLTTCGIYLAAFLVSDLIISPNYENNENYLDNYTITSAYEITSFDEISSIYVIKERDNSNVHYVYLRANENGTANIEYSSEKNSFIVYTNSTTVPHVETHKYQFGNLLDYFIPCIIHSNDYIYIPEDTILDKSTLTERG